MKVKINKMIIPRAYSRKVQGIKNSFNFLRKNNEFSLNDKIYFYTLNFRYTNILKVWYLLKVIKKWNQKTFSLKFIVLGIPNLNDLMMVDKSKMEKEDKIRFIFSIIKIKVKKNKVLEYLRVQSDYKIVPIKFHRLTGIRNLYRLRIKISIKTFKINIFQYNRFNKIRVGNKIIYIDYVKNYKNGEIYLCSELFKSGESYYVKIKKDRRVKYTKFKIDKMILIIRNNHAIIRTTRHNKEVYYNAITSVSSGMAYHFGHFVDNDLMGIRFNDFQDFKIKNDIKIIVNNDRQRFVGEILNTTDFKNKIVEIPKDYTVHFENLFLTKKPLFIVENYKIGANFAHKSPIRHLNLLSKKYIDSLQFPNSTENSTGIFLIREYKSETLRKISNRDKLIDIAKSSGIKIIDPTKISLSELYMHLESSKVIITEWGSTECNFKIFPVRGKKIIHLMPESAEDIRWGYPALLSQENEVFIILGKSINVYDRQSNLEIDSLDFTSLLNRLSSLSNG